MKLAQHYAKTTFHTKSRLSCTFKTFYSNKCLLGCCRLLKTSGHSFRLPGRIQNGDGFSSCFYHRSICWL